MEVSGLGAEQERDRAEPNGVTNTDILGTNCSPGLRGRAISDRPYNRNDTERALRM